MKPLRRLGTAIILPFVLLLAGCADDVKIGAVISETGGLADPYGTNVRRGIDLALEEINDAGGFKDAPVELVYRDDASDPATGRQAAKELIESEGVNAIIGAVSSPVTLAMAPVCEKHRIVLLSPSSSAPAITDAGEYIFRNFPSDVLEGTRMADFARDVGVHSVAIVAIENEFGAGLREVFTTKFESRTRKVVETFSFPPNDTSSFPSIVEKISELDPDGVYIVAYVAALSELLKGLHEAGVETLKMASGAVTERVVRDAGKAADQLVYAQPAFEVASPEEPVASFVKAYTEKFGEAPDIYAAHGYDAMKIVHKAMTDTGFALSDEIKRGLLNMSGYEGTAGRTSFDEYGDVVRYPRLFIINEDMPQTYEWFEAAGGVLRVPASK